MTTPAEIVATAKEFLDGGRHWTKGTWHTGPPVEAYCLLGALRAADGKDLHYWHQHYSQSYATAFNAVKRAMLEQYGGHEINLALWNDEPVRTWPEIEAVLDKALLRLEEEMNYGQ